MPKAHAIAFAVAAVLFAKARLASADPTLPPATLVFGVPMTTVAVQTVEQAHYVYLPVLGPWVDIARHEATSALVADGILQDIAAFSFVAAVGTLGAAPPPGWRFAPWLPQSGGGGFSFAATF
jgi:hypothetical protein